MQQRLPSLLPLPIAFAHRGARAHAPENTLHAFQLARRLGANGLETDAWVTSDGRVVLDHDGVVRRFARKVPLSKVPREALPHWIPDLDELLESIEGPIHLSIDVKDVAAGPLIISRATRWGFPPDRLWLCYDRLNDALEAAEARLGANIVDSSRLANIAEGVERRSALLAEKGVAALNMRSTDWTGGLVTLVHRFGVLAFGWDMQQEHEIRSGLRMGLDALYSDHVDRLVDGFQAEVGSVPRA